MIKTKTLIISITLSLLVTGASLASNKVVPNSEFKFNGVAVTQPAENADAQYGTPEKTEIVTHVSPEGRSIRNQVRIYKHGIQVTTPEEYSQILNIKVTAPGITTAKGIQVGSTAKEVVKKYGDPHAIFPKGDIQYYGYYNLQTPPQGLGGNVRLYLGIKDNQVVSMELTQDDSNFATMPLIGSKMYAINGIRLHYGMDYIRSIYGNPTGHTTRTLATPYHTYITQDIYTYGDSVKIIARNNSLFAIEVTANNGWTAPGGIAVGMSVDELLTKYGFPTTKPRQYKGQIYYSYNYANVWLDFGIEGDKISSILLQHGGD